MSAYRIGFCVIIGICLSFCAQKKDPSPDSYKKEPAEQCQSGFLQEIKSVYFQKWTGDQEQSGQGIYFYIEFKEPLSSAIQLKKIYFHDQEASIEKTKPTSYKAKFHQQIANQDIVLEKEVSKEYGNKAPIIAKLKFDLKPDEALLEYESNNVIKFLKLSNIKER